jgi:PGF-CTERM protein
MYCYQKPTVTPTPVCPDNCFCATEEDAKRYGYVFCQGIQKLCGYDQYQKPMYCYQKPTTTPTPVCPDGCFCATEEDAKRYGYVLCQGIQKLCGYDQYQKSMYCYQKPTTTPTPVCPDNCFCATEEDAKRYGYVLCQGIQKICGYDQYQKPLYCYEKPIPVKECPTGCECLSKEEGYKRNLDFCTDEQGNLVRCEVIDAQQGIYKYCFRTVEVGIPSCSEGCECLSKEEGYKRNLDFCTDEQGNLVRCKVIDAQQGIYEYCFRTVEVGIPTCSEGCTCLTVAEAKELGYELCKGEKIICGYDQYQNPMYCYQKPSVTPTPTPVCTEGCVCLAVDEANKLGFALCKGEKIFCGYDQYQKPMYCYEKPALSAKALPLERLLVEIVPENVTAKPGDTVTYKIKVEWSPETWEGTMDMDITINALGFEKTFEYPSIHVTDVPPLIQEIPITIPDNAPPSVYKAVVTVKADEQTATDETSLTLKVPGFEALIAIAGLFGVAYLMRRRR